LFASLLHTTASFQQQGQGGTPLLGTPLMLILIFAIFYFLLILPQQRRQKRWQAMLNDLKNGDRVVTSGGISGTIIALRDQVVHLRVPPDGIKLEVARSAVVQKVEEQKEAAKS
jgi:preprotein translocase subunit YajC